MRLIAPLSFIALLSLLFILLVDMSALTSWAADAQRGYQNQMAATVHALKMGQPGAYFALLSVTAAYGFVHALGPGHGKYLVGGVGLGTNISAARLLTLAVTSSLAQALWSIVLVYGGFLLLETSAQNLTRWTEDILAPASYLAISCVGIAIMWRGARALRKSQLSHNTRAESQHTHHSTHDASCGCGHAHGPSPEEIARITSLRDAIALIFSIAIRPCTGAVFLLVITWQMDIKTAGALAVIVMGLGTAALTSIVALSSTTARHITALGSGRLAELTAILPAMQVFVGGLILMFSLGLLGLTF